MVPTYSDPQTRRLVLIDFDWEDSDLLPELLRRSDVSVRLVAGEKLNDAGMRVAELCGLRSTTELADLTREIFDLALVGEHSARRGQIERLLDALGTPVVAPRDFLGAQGENGWHDASAPDTARIRESHENLSDMIARAIPDLTLPERHESSVAPTVPARSAEPPRFEDRAGLERALARWMADGGATTAELRAGEGSRIERLCRGGPQDPLLETLIASAITADAAQVVSAVEGSEPGRLWGAWPIRSRRVRGVLAAAAIDANARAHWSRIAREISERWLRDEDERALPRAPRESEMRDGWLPAASFRARLELAVERNRRDGLRFSVHRVGIPDAPHLEEFLRHLPEGVRGTDFLCRAGARHVLMLVSGSPETFAHVRRRLVGLWERSGSADSGSRSHGPLTDECIELVGPADAEGFLSAVDDWL
jgi:hypothetical protein